MENDDCPKNWSIAGGHQFIIPESEMHFGLC
jgi:hypothetical protein